MQPLKILKILDPEQEFRSKKAVYQAPANKQFKPLQIQPQNQKIKLDLSSLYRPQVSSGSVDLSKFTELDISAFKRLSKEERHNLITPGSREKPVEFGINILIKMLEFDEEYLQTTIPKFFKPATLLNFDTNLLTISFLQKGILTAIQDLKFEGGELPEGIVQAHLDSIFGILVDNEFLGPDGISRLKSLGSKECEVVQVQQKNYPLQNETAQTKPHVENVSKDMKKPSESVSSDTDSSEIPVDSQEKNITESEKQAKDGALGRLESKHDDIDGINPNKMIFRDETSDAQRELYEMKNRLIAQVDELLDEEQKKLSHQVTFYFGDNNYFRDFFILNKCKTNKYNGKSFSLFLTSSYANQNTSEFQFYQKNHPRPRLALRSPEEVRELSDVQLRVAT